MKALLAGLVVVAFPICYFAAQPPVRVALYRPEQPVVIQDGEAPVRCYPLDGVRMEPWGKGGAHIAVTPRTSRAAVVLEFATPVDLTSGVISFEIHASAPVEGRFLLSDANRFATHSAEAGGFNAGEGWTTIYIGKKDLRSAVDARQIRHVILEFGPGSRESALEIDIKGMTLLAQQ